MTKVAVGVLLKNNQVLIACRPAVDRFPNKWEFPGGKLELGELPAEALVREFKEELGILVKDYTVIDNVSFDYSETLYVELYFFLINSYEGNPVALYHAQLEWVEITNLPSYDFLDADLVFVSKLVSGQFRVDGELAKQLS